MKKIAVIGTRDSVSSFGVMGISVYTPREDEVERTIEDLARDGFGVIFITEELAEHALSTIRRYDKKLTPAIVMIPSSRGSLGIGRDRIDENVEKALGSKII